MDRGSPAVVVLNPNIRQFPFAIISLRVLQSLDFEDVKPIKKDTPTSSASGWRPRAAAVAAAVAATATKGAESASTALNVAKTQTTITTDLLNVGEQRTFYNEWITLVIVCLTAVYMWYTYDWNKVLKYLHDRVYSSIRHVRRGAVWYIGGNAALRGYDEGEETPSRRQIPPVGGDRAADQGENVDTPLGGSFYLTSPDDVIWYQNVDSRAALSPNNESIIPLVTNSGYPWQAGRLLLLLWRIPSPSNRNKLHADRLCSVLRRPGSRQADAIEIDITATDHRRYCQVCVGTLMAQIASLYPPPPLPLPAPPNDIQAWMEGDDDEDDDNTTEQRSDDESPVPYEPRSDDEPPVPLRSCDPTGWDVARAHRDCVLARAVRRSEESLRLARLRAARVQPNLPTQNDDVGSDSEETSDGIDSNPSVDDSHLPNHRIPSQRDRAQRRAVLNEIALHYDGSQRSYSTTVFSNDRIQLDPRQVSPCAMQG
jgi:hypothetical protein